MPVNSENEEDEEAEEYVPEVVVVSSNVFTTESNVLIDGESRTLHIVAELRNDSSCEVWVGRLNILFFDSAGNVVCKRHPYPFDEILSPGGITAVSDFVPSLAYMSNETNDYPEDWARYEISLTPKCYQSERSVSLAVKNVVVTKDEYGWLVFSGTVVNNGQVTARNIETYAILYSSSGSIVNADYDLFVGDLLPGNKIAFEITFQDNEPIDYDHYIVDAY
jgi:hypothetical protein